MSSETIIAYELQPDSNMNLRAAKADRQWMDESDQRYAYRCLPLSMANQNGWIIECPVAFSVRWSGGLGLDSLSIQFADGVNDARITSHFGHGVLTFSLPYLFRTPSGVNLWVKGPSNYIKDGVQALEGIVETDWSAAPFTMNWRITRADQIVTFERGEPICMIVPVTRHLAEQLTPIRVPIETNPSVCDEYRVWERSRAEFNQALRDGDEVTTQEAWQRDYFRGRTQSGAQFTMHQTRLHIREFGSPYSDSQQAAADT